LVREAGGVIPGAAVTLTSEATNIARHTQTNTVGEYAFVNVDPGTYTVRVSTQGFRTIENKGVRIGTQQFVTLDFTLEVGNLQEAVTVESQASPSRPRTPPWAARSTPPRSRPCPPPAATRSSSRPSRPE
jgi:ribosomal protein L28